MNTSEKIAKSVELRGKMIRLQSKYAIEVNRKMVDIMEQRILKVRASLKSLYVIQAKETEERIAGWKNQPVVAPVRQVVDLNLNGRYEKWMQ